MNIIIDNLVSIGFSANNTTVKLKENGIFANKALILPSFTEIATEEYSGCYTVIGKETYFKNHSNFVIRINDEIMYSYDISVRHSCENKTDKNLYVHWAYEPIVFEYEREILCVFTINDERMKQKIEEENNDYDEDEDYYEDDYYDDDGEIEL